MHYGHPDTPEIHVWPEPLTMEQYVALTPETIELVEGFLLDGPEARLKLLAALLRNCGLEAAVDMAHWEDWLEALDRQWGPKMTR